MPESTIETFDYGRRANCRIIVSGYFWVKALSGIVNGVALLLVPVGFEASRVPSLLGRSASIELGYLG